MKKYENWAHSMFPKMKFEDAVGRCEVLGKKFVVKVHFSRKKDPSIFQLIFCALVHSFEIFNAKLKPIFFESTVCEIPIPGRGKINSESEFCKIRISHIPVSNESHSFLC